MTWRTLVYIMALADAIFAYYLVTNIGFFIGFLVFWFAPLLVLFAVWVPREED